MIADCKKSNVIFQKRYSMSFKCHLKFNLSHCISTLVKRDFSHYYWGVIIVARPDVFNQILSLCGENKYLKTTVSVSFQISNMVYRVIVSIQI